jgi:predicted Zn-dependent protease with MMP-like domain
VTIYKDGHEAEADSWEELVEEVRRTILHEVGHHFGMEEEDLPY